MTSQQECPICNEEINEAVLACGHYVHFSCIAQSGKEECPMCRHAIVLPSTFQEQLREASERNRAMIEQQNQEATEQMLQAEETNRPRNVRRRRSTDEVQVGPHIFQWRDRPSDSISLDQFFSELAQIHYATPGSRIESDRRILRVSQLMFGLKEQSILLNIPLRTVAETIMTLFEE